MSTIVKDTDALIDMSQLKGNEADVEALIENGKSSRQPPIAPYFDYLHIRLFLESVPLSDPDHG